MFDGRSALAVVSPPAFTACSGKPALEAPQQSLSFFRAFEDVFVPHVAETRHEIHGEAVGTASEKFQ